MQRARRVSMNEIRQGREEEDMVKSATLLKTPTLAPPSHAHPLSCPVLLLFLPISVYLYSYSIPYTPYSQHTSIKANMDIDKPLDEVSSGHSLARLANSPARTRRG